MAVRPAAVGFLVMVNFVATYAGRKLWLFGTDMKASEKRFIDPNYVVTTLATAIQFATSFYNLSSHELFMEIIHWSSFR